MAYHPTVLPHTPRKRPVRPFKDTDGLTFKQRAFVDELLSNGGHGSAAYRVAYPDSTLTGNNMSREARRLIVDNKAVAAVLERAHQAAAAKTEALVGRYTIDRTRLLRELVLLGMSNMADYVKVDEHGDPTLSFAELTRDQMAAVHSMEIETYVEGKGKAAQRVKRVKFRLHPKRDALIDVARIMGWIAQAADPAEPEKPVAADDTKRQEARARVMRMLDEMARAEPLVIEGKVG